MKLQHDFNNFCDSLLHEMRRNQNQNKFAENDYFTALNIIDFL